MRKSIIVAISSTALVLTSIAYAWALFAGVLPIGDRVAAAHKRLDIPLQRALVDKGFTHGAPIFIRIFKEEAELEVWLQKPEGQFSLFRTYPICTFSGALGPKLQEGDRQAPEGFYFVTPDRMNPKSRFHLSFNLGYPNAYDQVHGRTGSALMVHGSCVSIGCYAMTDRGIEEIYLLAAAAFAGGQAYFRVHIFPFRMTEQRMQSVAGHRWALFWNNLLEGYLWFERTKIPPNTSVKNKRYHFETDAL